MTIEEIRKGAPSGATHHLKINSKVNYLQISPKGIKVWKDYDIMSGWFYASPTSVLYYKDKIKPLS